MTRSSQPVREHILDFDDDFERTLRRRRNQQESNPPSSEPDLEEQVLEEEEDPTAQVGGEVQGIAMDNRTLKELSASGLDNAAPLCIQYPTAAQGKTEEFELKSSLLHHIPKFHGLSMEDPNKHLKEFEMVCSSMTPVNVDGSILKMKAFPFSLMDKAKDWLYELAPGTVMSWESMKRAFLEKFFLTSLIILLRKKISGIQQEEGGALVDKTPMAAKILIANRVLNAQQYKGVGQRGPPRQQVHEIAEGMKIQGPMVCGVCSIQGHAFEKCPQLIENGGWESANAIGFQSQNQPRNDPYSNTYNPGTSLDNDALLKILTKLSQGQDDHTQAMHNTNIRVDQLEKQIGQIAEFVGQFRDQGKLPSSTIANSKGGFETAKAITLRSGKEVRVGPTPSRSGDKEDEKLQFEKEETSQPTAKVETPLPQNEEEEKDVLETFRKVHVNIPLLDAIKQILKYAKCLKKLCTTKKRVREKEVVHLSENVSAILQRRLPPKCKDPGSFTIPCVIGNTRFKSAMLDLGASINVMPYSVYASMNLGALKHDGVIIQLADRSNTYPKGVLEDVLVQVDHLIFPADFYVLDMEDSGHSSPSPLLLGRPFMKMD
ncbi:unnamed protein product [Malus baccata var. baccata]